jgi:ATP-binding cassette, subfamily B, bacterial PglK
MYSAYGKLWQLLSPTARRQSVLLLVMILIMSLMQTLGVASVMPFMSVVANPDAITTNAYLADAYTRLGFSGSQQFLIFLGVLMFLALIVSIGIKAVTTYAIVRFVEVRNYSLSRDVMEGYLGQPYDWYLNRHSADLGKTILSETEQVITGALSPAMYLLSEGAIVIALVALLIYVHPPLAVALALGIGGAYTVVYLCLRRYLSHIGAERVRANQQRFESVQETFGSIKDVKVNGLEGLLLRRFDKPARRFAQTRAVEVVAEQMPRFVLEALAFGGLVGAVIYFLGKGGGLQQALPVLALYAFGAYRIMPALQNVYASMISLRFSRPALDALYNDAVQLRAGRANGLPLDLASPLGIDNHIRLERVTYSYPLSDRVAIRDMSLEIGARTTVGLVGATGAGKTTVVDIILGLLRPQQGLLEVDGIPISEQNLRAWQATVGYVPQDIYLADASVAANIAFGVPAELIDAAAVERAARIANLHDFVTGELPERYETPIGERGVRLSGGQRQRIGIARALYRDPEVLIFDEATSALDGETERTVMEAVRNLERRKTIILIAHRLTTVRTCDKVFLLESGRLVDEGTFEEVVDGDRRVRVTAR